MIDQRLRATKDRLVDPLAARVPTRLTPVALTGLAFVVTIVAAALAGFGMRWWSVGAWLAGRAIDGLDGAVARRRSVQSDLGGYLDLVGDTIGYAAVPIGIAAAQDDQTVWVATALLLASFYVNAMSWTLLAAIAEKGNAAGAGRDALTTVHMAPGLIEGAETIAFYTTMLVLPDRATVLVGTMAVLVVATAGQRVVWALRSL